MFRRLLSTAARTVASRSGARFFVSSASAAKTVFASSAAVATAAFAMSHFSPVAQCASVPISGVPGTAQERSFLALKPDAVQRHLIGKIIQRFEEKGFKLVALKMITPTEEMAKAHYADLANKPFFGGLVKFFSSGPIVAMVLSTFSFFRWCTVGVVHVFPRPVDDKHQALQPLHTLTALAFRCGRART